MSKMRIPTRNGLVGEWLLDGSGIDTSGSGNTGTFTNGSYATTDRGYQSQAGVFNGSNAYVSTNFSASNFTGTYSIVGWFSKSTVGTLKDVCSVANNSAPYNDIMSVRVNTSGKLEFNHVSGASTYETLASTQTVTDGKPHFFEAKFTGTTMSLTVDDVTVTRSSGGNSSTSGGVPNLRIGRNGDYSPSFNYFDGNIQSIRIFNRYLSSDDRQDLYLEGLRKLGGGSLSGLMDGVVAYYDFRGDANDIVGGKNGTVSGATLTADFFGNANSAYSFNGSSSVISGITNWGITSKFAAVILTKSSNWAQAAGAFFGIENQTPNNGAPSWGVFTSTGVTKMFLNKSYVVGIGNSNALTLSNNTHYVFGVSYDGTTATFYQDGVAVGTATSAQTFNTANAMAIGRDGLTTSWFLGQHDRLIVFKDVTKSSSEMKVLNDILRTDYPLPFN